MAAPNDGLAYPQAPISNQTHTNAAVVIIGAGISGMCTAIDLIKRSKITNFVIIEKSSGLGGTWRDNKYPGCCCDVWSHLYSFSFEQNADWTREYPGQEEILRYLVGVAQKYELYRYIRFNTAVDEAKWDDVEKKWKTSVTVAGGKDAEFGDKYTLTSDFLVSAVGQLNVPRYPDIEGLSSFRGKTLHSARWDWSYDLKDKRIAIIGNGATAAQIIPELAKVASKLTIHQRTPNWVIPRLDVPIPTWKRNVFKYLPAVRWRYRADMMDFRESFYDAVFDNQSPVAQFTEQMSKDHMHAQLPDRPDLWEKLQPTYSVGCKRVIITDDYFPVFMQDTVKLETGHINKITEQGIVTDGVEEEYDLIVTATGFRTVEFMHPINITGPAGRNLASVWAKGGRGYLGVTVESLPNFAMLYGPNTNLGHNSIILMIEAQSRYINALIKEVVTARANGGTLTIQVKKDVLDEYNKAVQEKLQGSSFADPKCNSWYKNEEGVITNNWSGTVVEYQKLLSKVSWADYTLSGTAAEQLEAKKTSNLGRVVEETIVSYQSLGIGALLAAGGGGRNATESEREVALAMMGLRNPDASILYFLLEVPLAWEARRLNRIPISTGFELRPDVADMNRLIRLHYSSAINGGSALPSIPCHAIQ